MEERPFRKRAPRPVDAANRGWPSAFARALVRTAAWMLPPLIVLRVVDSGWRWPAASATWVAAIFAIVVVEGRYADWKKRNA